MGPEVIVTAINWLLIVFIGGFIGYFGKYLGKILIAKFHERRRLNGRVKELELEKERLKLEKKKLKLEKKRRKIKDKR